MTAGHCQTFHRTSYRLLATHPDGDFCTGTLDSHMPTTYCRMAGWEKGTSPVLNWRAQRAVLSVTSTLGEVNGSEVVALRQVSDEQRRFNFTEEHFFDWLVGSFSLMVPHVIYQGVPPMVTSIAHRTNESSRIQVRLLVTVETSLVGKDTVT